jgi:hypothetical protein
VRGARLGQSRGGGNQVAGAEGRQPPGRLLWAVGECGDDWTESRNLETRVERDESCEVSPSHGPSSPRRKPAMVCSQKKKAAP